MHKMKKEITGENIWGHHLSTAKVLKDTVCSILRQEEEGGMPIMDFFFPFEVDKKKNDQEVAKKLINLTNQKQKSSPNYFEWKNILGTLEKRETGSNLLGFLLVQAHATNI